MSRLRLLLGSFLNVPDQGSPYCWKLSKGNPQRAGQPCCPRSRGRSSKQKARPVGNKKELPNFNKSCIKVSTAEQKFCQDDVYCLARDNSKRKVILGFCFFPSIAYSSLQNAPQVILLHTPLVTHYHLSGSLLQLQH